MITPSEPLDPFFPWGEEPAPDLIRGGPKGRMRGPSRTRKVPPHQFGQMTYGRTIAVQATRHPTDKRP
jgi:hypothetical protein